MPQRLTGLDAAFLYLETPTSHMHVGSVIILDPHGVDPEQLTARSFAAYVERRLHLAPPFRRRLVEVPFRLDHPQWIEDPNFDIDFHVRRAALPSPGGLAELAEFVGDVMGRRLDRARPLWELWVVEGLEGGRVAQVSKVHHAAVDGVSGMEIMSAILQTSPQQEPPEEIRPWHPENEPSDTRLLASAAWNIVRTPVGWLRATRQVTASAAGLVGFARAQRMEPEEARTAPPPAPFAAPTTTLNGSIGPHRRSALASLSLADVKAVKNGLGGTVNDVILATVAGALRSYFIHHEQAVDRPLVAMVPISVRSAGQGEVGNRVSSMLTALPIHLDDPAERLAFVSSSTKDAKEQHGALGANTIADIAEVTPAGVATLAARLYTRMRAADRHRPIWNVVVSNVPGPRFPLYANGAKVEAVYPLGPVHEMCGLNITLFSYLDTIFVGLMADRELVPDVATIATAMSAEVDALAKVAAEVQQ